MALLSLTTLVTKTLRLIFTKQGSYVLFVLCVILLLCVFLPDDKFRRYGEFIGKSEVGIFTNTPSLDKE